ncbi:MAG: LysR family transcriptional regulator [Oscillospiraceae bacterium]|nr:LysR family transcriptional regulator [Oscillospiraceae bacterium]
MLDISLKQLEVFEAVAQYGSFTVAAEKLYLSQSTISSHVNLLEQALGVQLFLRASRKKVELTEDGQRLLGHVHSILDQCRALVEDVSNHRAEELRIGASSVPAEAILPEIVAGFMQQEQGCCCVIKKGDSAKVHTMLIKDEIQIGFVGMVLDRQNLVYEPVAEDHLVLVTANQPRYAAMLSRGFTGEDLLGEPMVLREQGSGTLLAINQYLEDRGMDAGDIRVVGRMESPEAIVNAVAAGMGVSILSDRTVEKRVAAGELLQFPLHGDMVTRKLYMVYKNRPKANRIYSDFINFVKKRNRG